MQLMPRTWAEMRALHGLGDNPFDARDDILAGTAYLRAMYDRFGYPGLFAAYNAGPGRYLQHVSTGRTLPLETRLYVAKLIGAAGREGETAAPKGRTLPVRRARSQQDRTLFAVRVEMQPGFLPDRADGVKRLFAVRR